MCHLGKEKPPERLICVQTARGGVLKQGGRRPLCPQYTQTRVIYNTQVIRGLCGRWP
nr:MAG TPA: hypothetical protein [Caudoviricetes sp.]